MKIALIFPKDSEALFNNESNKTFGGASVQMFLIAKELYNHKNIKIFSLISKYEKINIKDKFNLVKTFGNNDNIFLKLFKFHKYLNNIKPDIIIQHGLTFFSCLLAFYSKIFGIKFIFMFASDVESKGFYQVSGKKCLLFNMLLKYSSILFVQNSIQQNNLKKLYNKQAFIFKNGFEIKKYNISKKNKILWIGRSDKIKNPYIYIELAKNNPKYSFVMICPYSKNISKKEYEELKYKANLVKNLKFIEYVPLNKIEKYFKEAKLLINTSDFEGFPQTFIQAAISGTPIISYNVNPNNFLNKFNCGYNSNKNIEKLNIYINKIMNDDNLFKTLSQNIYKYGKKEHNIKKNVKKLVSKFN